VTFSVLVDILNFGRFSGVYDEHGFSLLHNYKEVVSAHSKMSLVSKDDALSGKEDPEPTSKVESLITNPETSKVKSTTFILIGAGKVIVAALTTLAVDQDWKFCSSPPAKIHSSCTGVGSEESIYCTGGCLTGNDCNTTFSYYYAVGGQEEYCGPSSTCYFDTLYDTNNAVESVCSDDNPYDDTNVWTTGTCRIEVYDSCLCNVFYFQFAIVLIFNVLQLMLQLVLFFYFGSNPQADLIKKIATKTGSWLWYLNPYRGFPSFLDGIYLTFLFFLYFFIYARGGLTGEASCSKNDGYESYDQHYAITFDKVVPVFAYFAKEAYKINFALAWNSFKNSESIISVLCHLLRVDFSIKFLFLTLLQYVSFVIHVLFPPLFCCWKYHDEESLSPVSETGSDNKTKVVLAPLITQAQTQR
jgi:hypothetical protein